MKDNISYMAPTSGGNGIPRMFGSFGPTCPVPEGVLQSAPMMPRGIQYCVINHTLALANLNLDTDTALFRTNMATPHLQYQGQEHNRGTEFVMVYHTPSLGGLLEQWK